jgi:TatD DNase family protein
VSEQQPTLVDTHCHLTFGELGRDPDRYQEQARRAGVGAIVLVGIDVGTSREVVAHVEAREGLHAVVGIHPNETAAAAEGDLDAIAELLDHPEVVALGESGLDLYWDRSPQPVQERWLEAHAELALARQVPLVLHVRDAYRRAAEVLHPFAARGLRAVVHSFGGETEEVRPFLDWGFFVSFSGILTYAKAENVRGAARLTPLELSLVETDAPWLTPAAERGKTNEPAFVVHTARRLAEVKGLSFEEVAAATTENARRLFCL